MVMSLPVISSDKMSKPKIESAREKQRPVIMTCVEFRSKCPFFNALSNSPYFATTSLNKLFHVLSLTFSTYKTKTSKELPSSVHFSGKADIRL